MNLRFEFSNFIKIDNNLQQAVSIGVFCDEPDYDDISDDNDNYKNNN